MARRVKRTTTERGYGWRHQRVRAALLAAYSPAQPCPRCLLPLGPDPDLLDLGHLDGDKTRWSGLEHSRCNRAAGARQTSHATPEPRRCQRTGEEITAAALQGRVTPCICGGHSRCW